SPGRGEGSPVFPTAPRDYDRRHQRRVMWIRRIFSVALVAFVVVALFGVFGQRNRPTTAGGGGYELEVLSPQITRPGLSSPFEVTVRRADDGPLPETLSIGDIVQQGVTQEDMWVTGAPLVVATMTAWAILGPAASQRWSRAGRILNGVPVVVVL